jgi:hypothetical protein
LGRLYGIQCAIVALRVLLARDEDSAATPADAARQEIDPNWMLSRGAELYLDRM